MGFFYTLSGAFFGAVFAYFFNNVWENKKKIHKQKEILISYFNYQHTMLRNLTTAFTNMKVINEKDLYIPLSQLKNNWDVSKLGFIAQDSQLLFESILQMSIELNLLLEYAVTYNESKKEIYIGEVNKTFIVVIVKITATMKNLDKYAQKYFNIKNLLLENRIDNIKRVEQTIASINDSKLQKEINEIKANWQINS